jgi:glutaredoxin
MPAHAIPTIAQVTDHLELTAHTDPATCPWCAPARRTDADQRTALQLADTLRRFGRRAADAHVPGTECAVCGALPGYVHPAGCTSNRHPELGTERGTS